MSTHPAAGTTDDPYWRERSLAWRVAEDATERAQPADDVVAAMIDRVIDNAAVSAAALRVLPVAAARGQAIPHGLQPGATVMGLERDVRVSPEWGAWANTVAVSHVDDADGPDSRARAAVPALIAVAQHCEIAGADLLRGLTTVQALNHRAWEAEEAIGSGPESPPLAATVAAGIGAALDLPIETVFEAILGTLHVREPASIPAEAERWSHAAAFGGKRAIEEVDRAMRAEPGTPPGRRHDAARGGRRPDARDLPGVETLEALAYGMVSVAEQRRFVELALSLPELPPGQLHGLTLTADADALALRQPRGIFDR